jgi:hypothetical protein
MFVEYIGERITSCGIHWNILELTCAAFCETCVCLLNVSQYRTYPVFRHIPSCNIAW